MEATAKAAVAEAVVSYMTMPRPCQCARTTSLSVVAEAITATVLPVCSTTRRHLAAPEALQLAGQAVGARQDLGPATVARVRFQAVIILVT